MTAHTTAISRSPGCRAGTTYVWWDTHKKKLTLRSLAYRSAGQGGRSITLDNVDSGTNGDDLENSFDSNLAPGTYRLQGSPGTSQLRRPDVADSEATASDTSQTDTETSFRGPGTATTSRPEATSEGTENPSNQSPADTPGWSQPPSQPYVDDWGTWSWPETGQSAYARGTGYDDAAMQPEGSAAAPPDVEDEAPYIREPAEVESATELPDLTELSGEEVVTLFTGQICLCLCVCLFGMTCKM